MRLRKLISSLLSLLSRNKPMSAPSPPGAPQNHHPSALRNRGPILEQMQLLLPLPGTFAGLALEFGSGTGAHCEVYAPAYPNLTWQPSEYVPDAAALSEEDQWDRHGKIGSRGGLTELESLDAHVAAAHPNARPAVPLDLSAPWEAWPVEVRDRAGSIVLAIASNVCHITPWDCSLGLLRGSARLLAPGGHVIIYGPFKVDGEFIGEDGGAGNRAFDERLRATNPSWGFRDVAEMAEVAAAAGLTLKDTVRMPANNLLLHFVKG